MDITLLVNVTARAWSLDILARIAEGTPCRQAPLIAATGAGRTAFAASLSHLMSLGLLERNPGHGHPLRPEFRLTQDGERIAPIAARIIGTVRNRPEAPLLRRSWTVPVLVATAQPCFFGEIRQKLTPITDRALSQSLLKLETEKMVEREVDTTARPPRPSYRAVDLGSRIAQAVVA
ncbi:MAG: winged helix-turn-helix transcriptional regulator [Pseudomonadota bacterium]|uniref:winged helix-turn-helix transcriptional regulator n=1 Tax=Pseudooceanicola nitratireducens TaxID=517719 RepID=UPI001C98998E|nr:winged helix-turn-helix transcriptional regulator [Pseudooceanicola nitratireducens]MBY6156656.1 winged helix-turn-helix transcriptional regulator [Pseudooceanicola nitratireducens]MBY6166539.1 winged helix-turn-helix transcriptional regulator [Pseudooceanicola nitratireducens]MEC7297993.1 winged helix-turn-helix transcriptional regulator [Pseudomonadota bacterium]MEC8666697.1 winged helix-turn-helix transcriptional regulator [Pseudomonadota bacterium]